MNASVIVSDLLHRAAKDLPTSWCDAETAEPTPTAREELTWSLVLHTLSHLLFRDPLPSSIRAGREHVPFPVDEASWHDFGQELGLCTDETRRQLVDRIAYVLRREPLPPTTVKPALPKLAAALLCLLDGFSRHGRGRQRLAPHQGTLDFDSETPDKKGASEIVDDLLTWAGSVGATPKHRYRIAFHVVWLPLSHRTWREVVAPIQSAPANLALPRDFLQRARMSRTTTSEPEAPTPSGTLKLDTPVTAAKLAPAEGDGMRDSPSEAILRILLEPLLALRGDPSTAIEEAEATGNGLAKDVLRAWRRVLLSNDLELYGEPGSILELTLPDRAWQVATVSFHPRLTDGPRRVRVVQRGVLLRGEVLVPGIAACESRPGGEVP